MTEDQCCDTSPADSARGPSLHHQVLPSPEILEMTASLMRMCADPTRLHLLWVLSRGESHVTDLVESVSASRTSVSQHLAKLRLAGIVDTHREGRHVVYRLRGGHVRRLIVEGFNAADHIVSGEPPHE